jgi:hypothetical protein
MAKTWVLDTETKGTGAHIAPLKRGARSAPAKLDLVQLHPPASPVRERQEGAPARARTFKVVDVFSGEVLAEDVTASGAVGALAGVRKAIDVLIYTREEHGRWRLLRLGESNALWAMRERLRAEDLPS